MASQERKAKAKPTREREAPDETTPAKSKSKEDLKAELDALLDEVDEVLESNAEEFVSGYVQKGGQ